MMTILPITYQQPKLKKLLYSSKIYMSRAAKKYDRETEEKSKDKALRHFKFNPALKIYGCISLRSA